MTISSRLSTLASVPPYLRNDLDREVIISSFERVQKMLNQVEEIAWTMPPPYLTPRQFVETVGFSPQHNALSVTNTTYKLDRTAATRRTGHWIGKQPIRTQ